MTRWLETDTLTNQSLVTALEIGAYTADTDRRIRAQFFADQVVGNGDYEFYITLQIAGTGSVYRIVPRTTASVESGVTAIAGQSLDIDVREGDVVKVWLKGLAGDTTTPDTIVRFFETESPLETSISSPSLHKLASSAVITSGSESGTYVNTHSHDDVYHTIEQVDNLIDLYYTIPLDANTIPIGVTIRGRLHEGSTPSGGDIVQIYAYHWGEETWSALLPPSESFVGLANSSSTNDVIRTGLLAAGHVNGDNEVRIRLYGSAMETGTIMYVDQIYVEYGSHLTLAQINNEVGNALTAAGVALTGADGDTLETLSDQLDGIIVPSVTDIDTQLSSSHGAGLWITAGSGTGEITYVYRVTDAGSGLGIDGVAVSVFTDVELTNRIASGITDVFGNVTFYLDAGTYYFVSYKAGYEFTNPDTEIVA